jgi:hypothetical protein
MSRPLMPSRTVATSSAASARWSSSEYVPCCITDSVLPAPYRTETLRSALVAKVWPEGSAAAERA